MTTDSRSPAAKHAYKVVAQALKAGTLQVPALCERCGGRPRERKFIHAHHDNYHEPLKIRWLCSLCHRRWHTAEAKLRKQFYAAEVSVSSPA